METGPRPPKYIANLVARARDYKVYSAVSSSIAASSAGTVQRSFNHQGLVVGMSCAATLGTLGSSNATAAIGYRDTFRIAVRYQSADTIVTTEILGTCLFGMESGMWWWIKPRPIKDGTVLEATITNLFSSTAITVDVGYHLLIGVF